MTRDRLRVAALAAVGALVAAAVVLVWLALDDTQAAVAAAVVSALVALVVAGTVGSLVLASVRDLDHLRAFLASPDEGRLAELPEDLRADARPVLERDQRLSSLAGQLDDLAVRDAETGVLTEREVDHRLLAEVDRVRRHGGELALLFLALDGLHVIEEEHGAAAVAELRRGVAVVLERTARPSDIVGRRDDGFVVILPHASQDGAVAAARRFARTATETPMVTTLAGTRHVRVRVGVACFPGEASSPGDLLVAARDGLERARREDVDVVRARA